MRTERALREAAARAVALAAVLAVGACGGDRTTAGPRSDPGEVVRGAPAATAAARTARIFLLVGRVTRGEGVVDFAARRARYTLTSPGLPDQDVVVAGGVSHVRTAPGGPWTRARPLLARSLPEPPAATVDPLGALDVLGAATDVVPYGGQAVRGASTIRYTFKVNPARATDPAVAAVPAGFVADAYVDADGRVRRVQSELAQAAEVVRPRGTEPLLAVAEYYDFGVPAAPADLGVDALGEVGP